VADQLLQYIIEQEHAGYSEAQIRQALAAQYSQPEIDAAFKSLKPSKSNPEVHEYVQQYARQGYTPVQIFDTLTKQGYPASAVRKSLNEVYGPIVMPQRHIGAISFAAVAIIVLAVGVFLIMQKQSFAPAPVPLPSKDVSFAEQTSQIVQIAKTQGEAPAVQACMSNFLDVERDKCLLSVATNPKVNDNALCDQIVDSSVHDACLMSFINVDFEGSCKRMKLADNVNACESIRSLRTTKAT
jgi:hypothetical protein